MEPSSPLASSGEQGIQENFITGETNVVHLFSSTEILLKIPNYTVFFDANVYPSIDSYLKDRSLEAIDTGLLYKEKLGINLLQKVLGKYPNLAILPQVAEEIDHMAAADLSQIRKKREQYEKLPTGAMNEVLDAHNRLTELGGLIAGLRQAVKEKSQTYAEPRPEVYRPILGLVKFLDEHLGSKKPQSREFNDTDERLVAAAFYQMFLENRNAAIYTRDEDVKRLVSTVFRFLMLLGSRGKISLHSKFGFTNIIVFKYHYEKGVFSRFFESQTTARPEDFIFPSRLREQEKSEILGGAQKFAEEAERAIGISSQHPPQQPDPLDRSGSAGREKAFRHIAALILDEGRFVPAEGEAEMLERENDLEDLLVLARSFSVRDVIAQVEATLEELRQVRIESRIRRLEARFQELKGGLAGILVPGGDGLDFEASRRLSRFTQEFNENVLEKLVLAAALEERKLCAGAVELERLQKAIRDLDGSGFDILQEKVCLTLEEIEKLLGLPVERIMQFVQTRKIPHEGRKVFLDMNALARLIVAG